jgi:tetratricopeptide (TPR) repeat protein
MSGGTLLKRGGDGVKRGAAPLELPTTVKGRDTWPIVLLLLTIVVTYWPVCTHEFTNWDDNLNVTRNPNLSPPTARGLLAFWIRPYEGLYAPLTYTIWWVVGCLARTDWPDAAGVWLNPNIFHAANLLLHAAAAIVVYCLLRELTARRWAACAGAALFALHPLQVEPVAWVTGLRDVLCGLLSVVALWLYVRFVLQKEGQHTTVLGRPNGSGERPTIPRARITYAAATAALIGAMLSKPSAITVPALAFVIDWVLLGRSLRKIAIALLPWAALAAVFTWVGLIAQPPGESVVASPVWLRPLVAADSLAFYVGKLVLPLRLSPIYPHSLPAVLAGRWIWATWLVPVGIAAIAWVVRRRALWAAAAVAIFAVALLPVLGLVPFDYQRISTVADRYTYVALLGPAMAVAFALASIPPGGRGRRWTALSCVAVLALLAARSFFQTAHWHDSATLFSHALEIAPRSDVAYCNLAGDALDNGRPAEAVNFASDAVRLNPAGIRNQMTLGGALHAVGRHDQAAAAFRSAAELSHGSLESLVNLAFELGSLGKNEAALSLCRRALSAHPESAEAHYCMASLLADDHQDMRALPEAAEAVRLAPSRPASRLLFAQLLERTSRRAEAAEQFAATLALAPDSSEARQGLMRTRGAGP